MLIIHLFIWPKGQIRWDDPTTHTFLVNKAAGQNCQHQGKYSNQYLVLMSSQSTQTSTLSARKGGGKDQCTCVAIPCTESLLSSLPLPSWPRTPPTGVRRPPRPWPGMPAPPCPSSVSGPESSSSPTPSSSALSSSAALPCGRRGPGSQTQGR